MASFGNRLKHAWNVFAGQESADRFPSYAQGGSYGVRPDRTTVRSLGDRSILTSLMTRMALDIAATDIRHVRLDATEKITQLNRPVENNMLAHVQSLTEQLYNQLGMTKGVFDGTASEVEMLNYQNRTIKPILKALTQGIKRTFLTKTARSQGQSIEFYRDPFENVAVKDIAEIADKLTRNEIVSSNEVRGFLGMTPVADQAADELRNKNLPTEATGSPDQAAPAETDPAPESDPYALDLSNP